MKKLIALLGMTFATTMALFSIIIANAILGANLVIYDEIIGKFYSALLTNNLLMPFIVLHIVYFICFGLLIWEYVKKDKK